MHQEESSSPLFCFFFSTIVRTKANNAMRSLGACLAVPPAPLTHPLLPPAVGTATGSIPKQRLRSTRALSAERRMCGSCSTSTIVGSWSTTSAAILTSTLGAASSSRTTRVRMPPPRRNAACLLTPCFPAAFLCLLLLHARALLVCRCRQSGMGVHRGVLRPEPQPRRNTRLRGALHRQAGRWQAPW